MWVNPKLLVEVDFRGCTGDAPQRQASLNGLRSDRGIESLRPRKRNRASV